MVKKFIDNDEFIQDNFEKLVERYAHQGIVICNGKIFTGPNAVKNARRKFPKLTPLYFPVPGEEEFNHLLVSP